ncbi:MAG TPA: AraC family transcriptional regulator [Anaerolineales bacterium]|nr:AraC family transcriptional regulator [Anaerolineales bacterium]
MILRVHTPALPLSEYIDAFVYYDGFDPIHQMDRFLPDGNTELIFNLIEQPQFIYHNETLQEIQTCRQAWVSGVRTRPITIPSGKGSKMLIVAFKKGKAYPFYPLPMQELTDFVAEADLIFGRSVLSLREQLLAASSIDCMFLLVEGFLFRQAGNAFASETTSRCVEYAVSSITSRPDRLGLRQLSDQIGYSQKHFISLFRQQVGVAPKQYLKIMRFQKAILEIEKGTTMHWSDIALQNGFYDQAHFIHEFRAFSGFTPGEYVKRKSALLNYIPVA